MIKLKVIIPIIIIIVIAGTLIIFIPNEKTILGTEIEEEWIKSGPFSIDKNEYNVGEKIFIVVNGLKEEDKGKVIFFRPLNNTAWSNYITMNFDGNNKTEFNLYFEPALSKLKNVCSINDLAGTWVVKFIGTKYSDITFEMMNQTSSWDKRTFDAVC
tara:strand:+ start:17 stop:487 length:471 start_codon:yes stop_codon:yes gene_type:complete